MSSSENFNDLNFGKPTTRMPKEIEIPKTINSYNDKTQKQIYDILALEVEHLQKVYFNYELVRFGKPLFNKDGSATYTIYFKRK